jgi:hypothetical protein
MDVDPSFEQVMNELAAQFKRGKKSSLIQDAIATYGYLRRAQEQGSRITITDKDNNQRELIVP